MPSDDRGPTQEEAAFLRNTRHARVLRGDYTLSEAGANCREDSSVISATIVALLIPTQIVHSFRRMRPTHSDANRPPVHTVRELTRRERSDRSGGSRVSPDTHHDPDPPFPACSAETAREAVGWMALESWTWRRIR